MRYENNLKDLQVTSQIESDMWMINLTYKINKTLRIVTHMFLFAEDESVPNYPPCFELPRLTVLTIAYLKISRPYTTQILKS